jgi:hypothetical protein
MRSLISWRAVAAASAAAWLLVAGLAVAVITPRPNPVAALSVLPTDDMPEATTAVQETTSNEPIAKSMEPAADLQPLSFKKAPASPALPVEEESVAREPGLPATEMGPGEEVTHLRTYGTQVAFVDTPSEAARRALKERKLLFVLHLSGNFDDKKFT